MEVLQAVVPARAHGTQWSNEEISLLQEAIKRDYSDINMLDLFPKRTLEAIAWKANNIGYGCKTDEGIRRFVKGVNHIKRKIKHEVGDTTNTGASSTVETIETESTDIIANPKKIYTEADAELDIKIATAEATVKFYKQLKEQL